jgi:elongation factor P--(R)-beta-lysine ligase
MKRLLAAGLPRLVQLGPCFRRGERGAIHHPEFTMLEWYRADAGYADILADAKSLIVHLGRVLAGGSMLSYQGREIDLLRWERIPVREAFLLHAGWDPVAAWDEDRFDLDLVERVEPAIPRDVPVVLTDYPAPAAALARLRPGNPAVAERWELYIGGLELANAYSELTDPDEQAARFAACADRRRDLGKPVYPVDEAFLEALRWGVPPCGGIALGLDRLLMLFADAPTLDDVLPFR